MNDVSAHALDQKDSGKFEGCFDSSTIHCTCPRFGHVSMSDTCRQHPTVNRAVSSHHRSQTAGSVVSAPISAQTIQSSALDFSIARISSSDSVASTSLDAPKVTVKLEPCSDVSNSPSPMGGLFAHAPPSLPYSARRNLILDAPCAAQREHSPVRNRQVNKKFMYGKRRSASNAASAHIKTK